MRRADWPLARWTSSALAGRYGLLCACACLRSAVSAAIPVWPGAATMVTWRYRTGAPGPVSPNELTSTVRWESSAASVTSRRESTWPDWIWPAPCAPTWKPLRSNCAPADLRAVRSARSLASKAAAPELPTARTSTRLAPVPKLAISSGAYSLTSWLPNWLRTEAVATTTSAPSGSVAVGWLLISRDAATPSDSRVEQVSGSQEMRTLAVTCWATQVAAWARVASAADSAPRLPGWPPVPV